MDGNPISPESPDRFSTTPTTWLIPLALSLAAVAALGIDVPVASLFRNGTPRAWGEFLEISEIFGHGYGVTVILIGVVVLDRLQLRQLPWLVAGSLGAGMVGNLLKLTLVRTRPRDFDFAQTSVWETFRRADETVRSSQSMPSSHTATAVGLAIVLSTLYPQGRWYFFVLAVLVGIQRIATSAHYTSDVFAGAAVGYVVGHWSMRSMSRFKTDRCQMPQEGSAK